MVFSKMFTGLLECIKGAKTEKRDAACSPQGYNEGGEAVMVAYSSNKKCFWQHTHCGNYVSATDSGDLVIRSLQQGDKSYRFNVTTTCVFDGRWPAGADRNKVMLFSFWNHVNPKERDYIIYDLSNNDVRVKRCEAIEEGMEEVKTDDSRFFVHHPSSQADIFEVLQCPGLYLACRDSTLILKRVDSQDLMDDREIHFKIK